MDEADIVRPGVECELADGFQERQPLDVTRRAADLGDDDIHLRVVGEDLDAPLDFIGDVRNDLNGLAEIDALALVIEDLLIDLTAGGVVLARELRAGEPLVMTEVEVRLRAVIEHIHLAVLVGRHRARIEVQVRVELLQRDLEAAVLEQGAERGCRDALAK